MDTYVAFAQDWRARLRRSPPRRDTAHSARRLDARATSRERRRRAAVGGTMQAKQEDHGLLSTEGASAGSAQAAPASSSTCSNTAIYRTGVNRLERRGLVPRTARVVRPARAGIADVIDGRSVARGGTVVDGESASGIFVAGCGPLSKRRHEPEFDLRIGFEQLSNVLRLVVSRSWASGRRKSPMPTWSPPGAHAERCRRPGRLMSGEDRAGESTTPADRAAMIGGSLSSYTAARSANDPGGRGRQRAL